MFSDGCCFQNPPSYSKEVQASLIPSRKLRQAERIVKHRLVEKKKNAVNKHMAYEIKTAIICMHSFFQSVNFSENK